MGGDEAKDHGTFVEHKYAKARYEYARAHDVMLAASEAARSGRHDEEVPSHRAFKATDGTIAQLRYAAENMTTAIISAADQLIIELLDRHLGESSKQQKLKARLNELRHSDPELSELINRAWVELFDPINSARLDFEHNGFWRNHFGIGQGDGPFMVDLIHETPDGRIYVLRDARRALHLLYQMNQELGLGHRLEEPLDICPDCGGDETLGGTSDMKLLSEIGLSERIEVKRTCGACGQELEPADEHTWRCPDGHS